MMLQFNRIAKSGYDQSTDLEDSGEDLIQTEIGKYPIRMNKGNLQWIEMV